MNFFIRSKEERKNLSWVDGFRDGVYFMIIVFTILSLIIPNIIK